MADRWAVFLDNLARAVDAGVPIGRSVELAGSAAGGSLATLAPGWAKAVDHGQSLASAITGADALITAILAAGERSGRLPALCRLLAAQRTLMDRLRWQAIGKMVYPGILAHAALMLPALVNTVGGGNPLWILAGPIALWTVAGAVVALWRWDRGQSPWWLWGPLGLVWWPLITSRSCAALAAATGAGLLADATLTLMAQACGHPQVARRLGDQAAVVRAGQTRISESMAVAGFPTWAIGSLSAAETAGRLELGAQQVGGEAAFRFEERATWAMRLISGAIFAIAALMAITAIFWMFNATYGKALKDAIEATGG